MQYKDGTSYTGNWVENKRSKGKGKFLPKEKDIIEGECE